MARHTSWRSTRAPPARAPSCSTRRAAGRRGAARVPADLSAARLGRARRGGDLARHARRLRARRWRAPALRAGDVAAHRHHQPARDHRRLGPRDRPADPQRHRLAGPPHRAALRASCAPQGARRWSGDAPAWCSTPTSPAPRSPGCSTTCPARAPRAERGELAFGTVDSWLLWQLTGGRVHATDATNASRTLLFDIRTQALGRRAAATLLRVPRAVLPRGARLQRRVRRHRPGAARRAAADRRHGGRPAGGRCSARPASARAWRRTPTAPAASCC